MQTQPIRGDGNEATATLSVVVPAFENAEDVEHCLQSIRAGGSQPDELIVVDDGSRGDAARRLEAACIAAGARLIRLEENRGPAAARNAGAAASRGDVLLFLDADVTVHADTVQRVRRKLDGESSLDAVFGSYDDQPAAPGAVSRFRNLLHHYVHRRSAGESASFWAGCGGVRRDAFQRVGGFDTSYREPSIEDVEFGARLSKSGSRIELDPDIEVNHRKRWTLTGLFRTDLFNRAMPWMELALAERVLGKKLNFGWGDRISVGLIGLTFLLLLLRFPYLALGSLAAGLAVNWPVYRFVSGKLGVTGLPLAMVAHVAHYLAAFLGAAAGTVTYWYKRNPRSLAAAALILLVAAALQMFSSSFTADFAGHPDESSHFVSSVMVSEFLDRPFQDPLDFAQRYYVRYPKIAIGHWPPGGYGIQGLWIRVAGSSREAMMILALLYATVCGVLIYDLLWREAGEVLAAGAAIAWITNVSVQKSYQAAMLDMPATMFCLLALCAFREYARKPSAKASLAFGAMAAVALLIKQSAIVLAPVPAVYIVLSRRWNLLGRRDFWMAAVPPLLLAGPWYIATTGFFYKDFVGWSGLGGRGAAASGYSLSLWWTAVGIPVAVLALAGVATALRRAGAASVLWTTALLSTVGMSLVLQVLSEPRYVLVALASQIALAALVLSRLPAKLHPAAAAALVLVSFGVNSTPHRGYNQVAATIEAGPAGHVLLSGFSDGAVIASAASRDPRAEGGRYWLRASKVLGDMSWGGRLRRSYVNNTAEVRDFLDRYGINQVFLDAVTAPPLAGLLEQALHGAPETWAAADVSLPDGSRLYRRASPLPPTPVSFFLPRLKRAVGTAAR